MKIKEIVSQHRRDYTALMVCEFCNHSQMDEAGYDDANYHRNVVPNIICNGCGESTISKGGAIEQRQTKYPEGFQV